MKKVLVLMMMLSIAAFAGDKKEHDHSAHQAEMKAHQHSQDSSKEVKDHVMISVPTIQCDNCVSTVEKAVKKLEGVESVTVDLEKKMAHINYDEKKVKVADIENAITASGYDANKKKRDEKAHNALPQCCQSSR